MLVVKSWYSCVSVFLSVPIISFSSTLVASCDSFLEWMDYLSGTNVEINDAYFALFSLMNFTRSNFSKDFNFSTIWTSVSSSPESYSWNGLPLLAGHLWQARCISCIWARLSKKSLAASSWTFASNATDDALFESEGKKTRVVIFLAILVHFTLPYSLDFNDT